MPDLSLLPATAVIDGPDLLIGGCSMADIAAEFGTPAFVIDEAGSGTSQAMSPPRLTTTSPAWWRRRTATSARISS